MVLFVDNVKGSHHSGGSGSTENPVRTESGSAGDVNAGGYRWQLETTDGKLFPLAEDIRGRGFRRDERLRGVDLELLVRRYHGAPVIQVIRAYELTKEAKFELDYWCEICAIAMFELKPCDCCQADIELRRRIVDKDGRTKD